MSEADVIDKLKQYQETRDAIRKKQFHLLELIKQRLSIEKLKQRNINFINQQLMGAEINLDKAMQHN